MSNTTTATITGVSIVVAERNDAGLVCQTLLTESRPASFDQADVALAYVSMRRTSAWELDGNGGVEAPVAGIDNRFNGTVAARLWDAVGTTHDDFTRVFAHQANDGDLISDAELSDVYVVAANRHEGDTVRIHMVGECKTWEERFTTDFDRFRIVQVARKR
jgi:hypothetical protein